MESANTILLSAGERENRTFFAPIVKNAKTGEYLCVLSHTALDRDDEIVGKKFMERGVKERYMPALLDHENKALGQVAKWINRRVEKIDGGHALVAEPKFFLSNPSAVILKGMLDEDAEIGVSISAIPSEYEMVEYEGRKVKMWTDGELVSADFVGIPAQKHAMALRIAKSFSLNKKTEEDSMTPEERESLKKEISAGFESKLVELSKSLEDAKASNESLKKEVDANKQELEKAMGREAEREKILTELNKKLPNKEQPANDGGVAADDVSANAFIKTMQANRKKA